MRWPTYLRTLLGTAIAIGVGVYAFVAIVDPYDSVFFSPAALREPVSGNQRYSYPALARSDRFDSAIFGTSTTRLLRPSQLDPLFGARFANLSMNSPTAYEQSELHKVFVRHHPRPTAMIYGIDIVWCEPGDQVQQFTERPFPPWLYDESRWNDLLYLFNFKAIEEAAQQLGFLIGLRERRYGADGYTDFLPPQGEYDLDQARAYIYGRPGPPPSAIRDPAGPAPSPEEVAGWAYPTHGLMRDMLAALPVETVKVLVFVPYHWFRIENTVPEERARWAECKRRLSEIAQAYANTHVLDFMISSRITREDANFWDRLHYNVATATLFGEAIARGVAARAGEDDLFRYLGGS